VVAHNGKEGVDIVTERMSGGASGRSVERPFDLIFMDVHMPVMDGLEATSKIVAMGAKTPIVALTANMLANDLELYSKSGMSSHLGKPFTTQELWKCLMNYLPVESYSTVDEQRQAFDYEALQERLKLNFVKSNQNTFAELQKALGKDDIKLAHRLAHTIKSNAGQIGEKALQEAAAVAEGRLLDGKNLLTPEQTAVLETELKAVLGKLAPMLTEAAAKNKAAAISWEEQHELFERLEDMLKNRNPGCIDLIEKLRAVPGTEELIRQIEIFHFKQALAALSEFKKARDMDDG
jgi:CheY-like chemotaxis protein